MWLIPHSAWRLATLVALIFSPALLAEDTKPVRIALFDDNGVAGKGVPRVSEILGKAGDIQVTIFPGSGSKARCPRVGI